MKGIDRRLWLIAVVFLVVIILLTLLAAPGNPRGSGSTYGRAPDGYGAWYAYMQQQGVQVQRWQKPQRELPGKGSATASAPITLLQIYSSTRRPSYDRNWISKGNTQIILGVESPVTEASFRTIQDSSVGNIRIDTRRRYSGLQQDEKRLLGDLYGTIVWQKVIGKGKVIFAVTPHLAANAYQSEPGNFKFLADLVTQQQPIWVDEYLHGYKDSQEIQQETSGNLWVYLSKTPLLPIFVQGGVLLLILLWAQNRRFGQPQTLTTPPEDNSAAYMQALASVLHKAQSSEFVLSTIGTEEKLKIQSALGLGRQPIEYETLRNAWYQQTGRPGTELDEVFLAANQRQRMSDRELLAWLRKLHTIRSYLP